jgi:hypothetical protein
MHLLHSICCAGLIGCCNIYSRAASDMLHSIFIHAGQSTARVGAACILLKRGLELLLEAALWSPALSHLGEYGLESEYGAPQWAIFEVSWVCALFTCNVSAQI